VALCATAFRQVGALIHKLIACFSTAAVDKFAACLPGGGPETDKQKSLLIFPLTLILKKRFNLLPGMPYRENHKEP